MIVYLFLRHEGVCTEGKVLKPTPLTTAVALVIRQFTENSRKRTCLQNSKRDEILPHLSTGLKNERVTTSSLFSDPAFVPSFPSLLVAKVIFFFKSCNI